MVLTASTRQNRIGHPHVYAYVLILTEQPGKNWCGLVRYPHQRKTNRDVDSPYAWNRIFPGDADCSKNNGGGFGGIISIQVNRCWKSQNFAGGPASNQQSAGNTFPSPVAGIQDDDQLGSP